MSSNREDLIADALGSLGAPQYVLVGEDGIICRACPKPSDGKLLSLIEAAVPGR